MIAGERLGPGRRDGQRLHPNHATTLQRTSLSCIVKCDIMHCCGGDRQRRSGTDGARGATPTTTAPLDARRGCRAARREPSAARATRSRPGQPVADARCCRSQPGSTCSLVELFAGTGQAGDHGPGSIETAPVLWSGEFGGEGRLLVGSDPLELWDLDPPARRTTVDADAHRPNAREALLVTRRHRHADGRRGRTGVATTRASQRCFGPTSRTPTVTTPSGRPGSCSPSTSQAEGRHDHASTITADDWVDRASVDPSVTVRWPDYRVILVAADESPSTG